MIFLSYAVSKGTLTGMYLLFLIPIITAISSFFAIKKLKIATDGYFETEDKRMEEFKNEQASAENSY